MNRNLGESSSLPPNPGDMGTTKSGGSGAVRGLKQLGISAFLLAIAAAAFGPGWRTPAVAGPWTQVSAAHGKGLKKLAHLIFIIQENRSFDHYFGTFPGADGIPTNAPCLPSNFFPSQCFTPYPNHKDSNQGGPILYNYQLQQIDGGLMDGFVEAREKQLGSKCQPQNGRMPKRSLGTVIDDEGFPVSIACTVDVMGYHDGTDLPNYWSYAQNFVLQDHSYESIEAWSLVNHLAIFSGWAGFCKKVDPPEVDSCVSSSGGGGWNPASPPPYLWTDITYMLNQHGITWAAYLDGGLGKFQSQHGTPYIWDVLPGFETVNDDGQVANAELNQTQYFVDAAAGTLPQVTWLLPEYADAEHPTSSIAKGQAYVTGLVNAAMSGPDWDSTAIFITYDDIGGFYDHEPPPFAFDTLGLGIRVPAMIISPYAKKGYIDHQICSTDCYLKFIEDVFLNGERMSQAGRPDPRPDYRDAQPGYGDLANDFNFDKPPRGPLLLSTHPMTMLQPDDTPAPRPVGGLRRTR